MLSHNGAITPTNSAASQRKEDTNGHDNFYPSLSNEVPSSDNLSGADDEKNSNDEVEEKLVFSGTDPDSIELAKSFWKSVTLQPPIESSLISNNINQRLPKAPSVKTVRISELPDVRTVRFHYLFLMISEPTVFHERAREDAVLKQFFARANEKLLVDRTERIKRLVSDGFARILRQMSHRCYTFCRRITECRCYNC